MIKIAEQTIDFFFDKMRVPINNEINITNTELLTTKGSCFVTIFLNGEVKGGAGNIKEIKDCIADEIIENTIEAISLDKRFDKLTKQESKDIKIRIDLITKREVITVVDDEKKKGISTISKIDPVKNGIIVIKKDYSKTTTILPNIDPKIVIGKDYFNVLSAKLGESFDEEKYIIYKIETKTENNY